MGAERASEENGRAGARAARPPAQAGAQAPAARLIAPAASAEEAAAIVAALERFMRDTAPAPAPAAQVPDGWRRAAMLEGVAREEPGDLPDPWINT